MPSDRFHYLSLSCPIILCDVLNFLTRIHALKERISTDIDSSDGKTAEVDGRVNHEILLRLAFAVRKEFFDIAVASERDLMQTFLQNCFVSELPSFR